MLLTVIYFVLFVLTSAKCCLGAGISSDIGCLQTEKTALLQFKQGLIDKSNVLASWKTGRDCCEWRGITCNNETGHVITLDLSYNYSDISHVGTPLSGVIAPSLLELPYLTNLDLSFNNFQGQIPKFIGSLSRLEQLKLAGANLSGPIPPQLGNLSSLYTLDLALNYVTFENLEWLSHLSSLRYLNMLYLNFSEVVNWPESISKLPSLVELHLSSCNLPNVELSSLSFFGENLKLLRSIDISSNNLSGDIPESVTSLPKLISLNLSRNSFTGVLPNNFGQLEMLESLDLSRNQISGSIPLSFSSLHYLSVLDLSYNNLSGRIPLNYDLSTKNRTFFSFDLSSNLLDGPLPPFPSSVADLRLSQNMFSGPLSSFCETEAPNLFNLDLSDNQLSGELPTCWMQFRSLFVLNMAKNNLSGKIPSSLGYLKDVVLLRLQDNKLSGELPSLENCTKLRVLDLGDNKLSGKIPTWIGPSLTKLLVLRLKSNGFYGSIPLSLCSLPALHVLDFSKNNLSGALPHCLPNITALSIDISSNNLSGDIPESVTSLLKLISLNLSSNNLTRNQISGVLPNNFGQLEMLESHDLSRNQISGSIPPSFSSLHFLGVLDLSYNNLSGRIPVSTQLQSFDASQFTGNLGLCGQPLTPECPGDVTTEDPAVPNGSGSDKTKPDDDGLISFGFYVGLALGFIIGFWSVCGTLVLKTSWRYAYFRFFDDIKVRIM
ncbi:receptor-like protein 12 [Pyrus ussuriensis x Pyrus communis]|uniref:Receptor-like protein 12 n=1 Tax=Pyrus ussuriensis x Pyrus communis TaxID=2448454 RepID=A0A5N5F6N8_9ROSA|nr:receptor-like protein 12 [Pyrus ussuriensis x Pyrus communis]